MKDTSASDNGYLGCIVLMLVLAMAYLVLKHAFGGS